MKSRLKIWARSKKTKKPRRLMEAHSIKQNKEGDDEITYGKYVNQYDDWSI